MSYSKLTGLAFCRARSFASTLATLLFLCSLSLSVSATEALLIRSDGSTGTKTILVEANTNSESEDDGRRDISKYRSIPPEEVIRLATAEVFDTLLRETISSDDSEKIDAIIKQTVMPVFDFGRIARRIMAKHFRKASKEQFFEFAVVFRQSLVNTYVRAFLATDYQTLLRNTYFEIGEAKYNERNQYQAIVPMELRVADLEPIAISFTMYFNKGKDTWLAENVNVEGVNLGLTYRNQFDEMMAKNKGDIDKTIKAWRDQADRDRENLANSEDGVIESGEAQVQSAGGQLQEIEILPLNQEAQPTVLQPNELSQ